MSNPVLSPDPSQLAQMIEMQKSFDTMAGSVGIVERKLAGLKGSFMNLPIVKAVSQLNNWRKSISKTIGVSTDWRNMSKEEKEEMKGKMTIMQKMMVPLLAYSKLGSMNNKIMAKHNTILGRITTKFLMLFGILGLIIMVFAAVSIAIDGANSPIVEMTEGIVVLEQIVGGLVLVFSGEDGEGGLAGAINLAAGAVAVFLVVFAVFGTTVAAIATAVFVVVGVFNLVKNATDSFGAALLAAASAATIAIGILLVMFTSLTAGAVAAVALPIAAIFALGAMFWAVATGKASDAVAFIAGIGLAILLIVTGVVTAPVAIVIAVVAVIVTLLIKHRDWFFDLLGSIWESITGFFGSIGQAGTDFKNGLNSGVTYLTQLAPNTLESVKNKIMNGLARIGGAFAKWGRGLREAFKGGIGEGLKYLWDTPGRAWRGIKRALGGAALKFIKWYNKNVAEFLKFKVPNWVPRIGGKKVSIPPKIKVPMLAKGGIVTGPTLAMIGEKGPEAVVPLGKDGHGMGNTFNIKIDVSGVTDRSDKRQLAMQISNEIQKEMRRYGSTTSRRAI